jgi:AraC-like DNA-binding protein
MTISPSKLTDLPNHGPKRDPIDLLDDVLGMVRLSGAIFLRAEYTSPWAYESPTAQVLTSVLQPEAKRLILFHIVAEGGCLIRVSEGDRLWAQAGELILIPYGDQHVMGSGADVAPVPIASLLPTLPWREFPSISYGGGGDRTAVVCGYLHCDDALFDPVVRALPRLFKVTPDGPAATWVAASIQYALNAVRSGAVNVSRDASLRLPELLFREVLRLYVTSAAPDLSGWLAALRDPLAGPALLAMHRNPAARWTAEELAAEAACSRSTLHERFVRLLGEPPMQYLHNWRMQLAAGLLRDTDLGVASVALRVGYESEEAFNRAFKRQTGKPPAHWRATTRS